MVFRDSIPALIVILPLVLVACGDDGPSTDGGTSETASGDGDPGDGDPGDGDPGDGDGDPGDGDPGDGDGDPGDGDGDPGDCEAAGDAYASFSLDVSSGDVDVDYQVICTSEGVMPSGETGYALALSGCVSQTNDPAPADMVLTIDSSPATEPFVQAQTSVLLRWIERPPFIPGKWFTLHDETGQTLLLAGVDGPGLAPSGPPDFDYSPLTVDLVSIGCAPFDHDSQCGVAERKAFEVGWDQSTATIADRNSGFVGQLVSYQIVVGSALDFVELSCDDFPNQILRGLFFLIPEG